MTNMANKVLVRAVNLGRMEYNQAQKIQKKCAQRLLREMANKSWRDIPSINQTLLLVEHNPVYTIGIRTQGYTDSDEHRLRATGAQFYRSDRGGLITFHGPGQLVAYPVINLKHFRIGMRMYIERLEQSVIEMCRMYGISASTSPDTGVWVEDRKIAAIGVHGSRYVTTHGIGLNCNTDLSWFEHIVPCGIEGKGVTSLTEELQRDVTVDHATQPYLEAFARVFDCDVLLDKLDIADSQ